MQLLFSSLKPHGWADVCLDTMSTLSTPMSTQEAAAHYQVSDRTIRRWIKAKRLKASRVNGQWYVYPDMDKMSDVSRQNVHNVHPSNDTTKQMQSEIDHLRQALDKRDTQIEQLNQLLAMQTQQNHQLIAQLPPPRQSIAERITRIWTGLRPQRR